MFSTAKTVYQFFRFFMFLVFGAALFLTLLLFSIGRILFIIVHLQEIRQFLLSSLLFFLLIFFDILLRLYHHSFIFILFDLEVLSTNLVYKFDYALKSCEIIFVLSSKSILVSEMLHELYIGVQIL